MTALVRFEQVSKAFGDTSQPVVTEISFEIPPAARIALIGPSGSGKSTILNLVAGLDRPSSGRITWPGLEQPLLPLQVGVAFQGPSLIPWLDVEENVLLPLQVAGTEPAPDEALALLQRLGVAALIGKLPDEVSGGQAQRIALARAMVARPRLLLADEPSGQLDRGTADATIKALFEWTDSVGAALLVATHDPEIARRFRSVWSLEHGKLQEIPA